MAIYRKQPVQFNISRGSDKRLTSLVPFRGLEINENPQLNNTGSCADMVNMTVDNDAFLTLRPRLVEDEAYWTARTLVTNAITFPHLGVTYTSLGSAQRLKDGYLFVVYKKVSTVPLIQYHTFIYVDDSDGLFWVDYAGFFQSVSGGTYANVFSSGWGFDNFIIFPEKDYYKFVVRGWTTSSPYKNIYKFYKDGSSYKFVEATDYVPTYKSAIIDTSTLKTSPIYEDLNIFSDKYKVSFVYEDESTLDISKLSIGATSVVGSAYEAKDFSVLTGKVIIQHDSAGFIYYNSADYTTASMVASGSTYDLTFYRYDFAGETASTAFIIKVYGTAGTYAGLGISKANILRLYSPKDAINHIFDWNGQNLAPFIYDISSNALVRVEYIYGAPTIVEEIRVLTYDIGTKTFTDTTILTYSRARESFHIFYTNGGVFIALEVIDKTVSLLSLFFFKYDSKTISFLIGKLDGAGDLVPASRPSSSVLSIQYIIRYAFINQGKTYIMSVYNLSAFTSQTDTGGTHLTYTAETFDDVAKKRTYLYYNVGSSIDNDDKVDLTTITGYEPNKTLSNYDRFTINGSFALFYNYRLMVDASNAEVLRVPLNTLDDSDTFDVSNVVLSNPTFVRLALTITTWGMPILAGYTGTTGNYKLSFAKIDADGSASSGFLKYAFFVVDTAINTAYDTVFYPTEALFNYQRSSATIVRVVISGKPIEITYSIENDDTNPLQIDSELLAKYNEYRYALNLTSTAHGTALMGNSRLLYNDKYVFISEPNNYDYYPTILANKTIQPVRFASSYMQTVGTIYERNNIEYVTFVDNPFVTTQYLAHTQTVIFQSVEQRAVDYLPNGHIVSYAGVTIYLNEGGVYALNFNPDTPQDSERKATLISKAINVKLLKEDLTTCKIVNSDPYVLFMFPKTEDTRVYAYDLMKQMWFYWELPFVVTKTSDDNRALKLYDGSQYVYFSDEAIPVEVDEDTQTYVGNVERYLDFDEQPIRWMWKSQPMALGSITSRKQITETYFVFVNQNASIITDENTLEIVQNKITTQRFGVRFYTYKELVTESPVVEYEGQLNIINNLRRRTYLNRFKYCQLLCYNIDSEDTPQDKVRLANIVITYKYLTGGK